MRVGLQDDGVRWARCLAEYMKHAGQLCEVATRYAYIDICVRIQVTYRYPHLMHMAPEA